MRVLVTGCAGFIGVDVVRQLCLRVGASNVWGLDLGTIAAVNWEQVETQIGAQLVHGDVTNDRIVRRLIERSKPHLVLHLAAQSHVDASLADPTGTMHTNAVGTQVVAHACAEYGVPMVYCSTDEVYGDAWEDGGELRPCVESDPLLPSSPYSAGKAAGEMAVRAAARSMGLRYVITRGCNAWGYNQGPDKLVPIACDLLQRGEPVPLHGGGLQVRQWIHVEEFAAMLIAVGEDLHEGKIENETYNLAGPTSCTVKELVHRLAEQTEPGLLGGEIHRAVTDRPGQDRAYAIDGGKLRAELGLMATRELGGQYLAALLLHYRERLQASPTLYGKESTGGSHARI